MTKAELARKRMDDAGMRRTEMVTPVACRLSYPHLFEMTSYKGGKPSYSAVVVMKKGSINHELAMQCVEAAKERGITKVADWGGRIPKKLWSPLRDGDVDREGDPVYEDAIFVNAKNYNRQPELLNLDGDTIYNSDDLYPGCYCKFQLEFYAYSEGIACTLVGVQFDHDGEQLGSVSTSPKKAFGAFDDDDEWEDDDI